MFSMHREPGRRAGPPSPSSVMRRLEHRFDVNLTTGPVRQRGIPIINGCGK
jgi:hypothetical protein